MKTMKSLTTILAAALVALASATEKPKMNVQCLDANRFLVNIQTMQSSETEVTIIDNSGNPVYYKYSDVPVYSSNTIFDVRNLENGEYVLKLKINDLISERKIVITDDDIHVAKTEEFVAPYFGYDGKKLIITHLNFENEKYNLEIFDDKELVYLTSFERKSPINAGFDVSELETGNYEVFMNSYNNGFNYHFEIQ